MKKFISFEGIDGCGKTTQITLLSDYLNNNNLEHMIIREPGGINISELCPNICTSNPLDKRLVMKHRPPGLREWYALRSKSKMYQM